MKVHTKIEIDIKNARKALAMACGNKAEEEEVYRMTEDEIVNTVFKHIRCWGIRETEGDDLK